MNACSRFLYLEALDSNETDAEENREAKERNPSTGSAASMGDTSKSLPTKAEPTPRAALPAMEMPPTPSVAIPVVAPAAQVAGVRQSTQQLRQDTRLMNLLRDAVKVMQDEQGWALIGSIGKQISNKASFDPRNYGYASISKLMAATQAFDMKDEATSRVAVRIKRAAKAGAASGK